MRESTPRLTSELETHCAGAAVWKAAPFAVRTFRVLVTHVARLAYANPSELLFFRGQNKDYQSKAGGTTLYPTIYRGDQLASRELRHRFDMLDQAAKLLVDRIEEKKFDGHQELRKKRYIQWSVLQHYEVVATPLLDITQSLRVACSFAQLNSVDPECIVYVLGLPFLSNRISINSEQDLVNIRLLSICPPAALRPYFQEGYLAGTPDVTSEYDSKTELDFRNRIIAKFSIPSAKSFWGRGFDQIPSTALYPKGDEILNLCNKLKDELREDLQPGDLGKFIRAWADLEDYLLEKARLASNRNVSVGEAIRLLTGSAGLTDSRAAELQALRKFRNLAVHEPKAVSPAALHDFTNIAQALLEYMRNES